MNQTLARIRFSRRLLATVTFGLVLSAYAVTFSEEFLRQIANQYGKPARLKLENWQGLVEKYQHVDEGVQLKVTNAFFNQVRFMSDSQHWGAEDYWATPVEMLATNGGDCEDYSIAKYFTLRDMGVPDEKLQITYVKAVELNQAHMVLVYYENQGAEPLVLDNLINDIKPASQRPDLIPVYSFNGEGLWKSKARGKGKKIGRASKVERWTDLNDRLMKQFRIDL